MYAGPFPDGPFGGPFGALFGPDGPFAVLLLLAVAAFVVLRISRGRTSPPGGGPGISASLLEALSVLAVGVLVAFFVGFGVQAFHPAPEPPEDPLTGPLDPQEGPPPKEKEFVREIEAYYQEELPEYNRTAAPIAVGVGVLILLMVPILLRRIGIPAIRDGVALGGVLTLLYGLVLALQAKGDVFKFLMVAVVLIVVLVAVYLRFRSGRPEASAG